MGTGSQKETTEIDFSGTLNCSDNTLNEAYMFSRRYKITTKPDCLSAAMDQPLARRDAAKMISNLAMNVYHRRPDKTKLCIFADMLDMDPEYQHYATTACQLGLMGIYDINAGAMNFYPDEYVDKAQFATMVSRMLYGSRYNEFSADRYQRHIQTLSDRGVLDSTADLFSPLPRGGAMLILMRL